MTVPDAEGYAAAMRWLHSRQRRGIDLGLERIRDLLGALGDPHRSFRTVHVAGTNGKGSVATLLARILSFGGHRTGLYTSPHLIRFTERIQVDGAEISREELVAVLSRVRAAASGLASAGDLTFFEICTATALLHFADQEVSWAVIETGMGGRLDATNVVHGDVAVITNVALDHTDYLGDDVESIAAEKAGIIEPGAPLVTGASGAALEVLKRHTGGEVVVAASGANDGTPMATLGVHQRHNAAVVRATCQVLRDMGVSISDDHIDQVLTTTSLPGRLETFEYDTVTVTIDAAHNAAGAEAVARHLDAGPRHHMILGFNQDKDWETMLDLLLPHALRVWAVPVRSPRSLPPQAVADYAKAHSHVEIGVSSNVAEAMERAKEVGARDLLVTGSGTLAGEARAILTGQPLDEVDGSR